jgi:hypothetical protein
MDQFLKQDKETLAQYIQEFCPSLPYKAKYIETQLKPLLEKLVKTDGTELVGLFWPYFDPKLKDETGLIKNYDQQFKSVIEKKGMRVKECEVYIDEHDEPYDYDKLPFLTGDIRLAYSVTPGTHVGYIVKEPNDDDKEYFDKASVIMDDIYKSSNMDNLTTPQKKKALMNLMRFIDATRCFVEKSWPNIAIKEELLKHLQEKYDAYDEAYDELAYL